ncbi:class I SAM-dependent methyltransferase [Nocardioides sp. GXZ039]|uniref:class I SAM-dependent methyltransferase n=1 Tax=Nocardioides sp. GXZ039 TaxID=3136018 RepID=UPI0030F386F9
MSDLRDMFTREFWDERYATSHRIWSGEPNGQFVEQVASLAPGTAMDVGCGEGADAVWLATHGWTVTGVDVSGVALERAAEHAAEAGVGEQTSWLRADVFAGDPLPGGFDLVSAAFVHVPPDDFETVYGALADAVAPGGSLVVLAHHPDDEHTGLRNADLTALLFTPEAVVALLDPEGWEVVTAATPTRSVVHDGREIEVTDTVVRAVRRPADSLKTS